MREMKEDPTQQSATHATLRQFHIPMELDNL